MKRVLAVCMSAALVMGCSEQVSPRHMSMDFKRQGDTLLVFGVFGEDWEPKVVRNEVIRVCREEGKGIVGFEMSANERGQGTNFEAECVPS